ncbi:hypothetical protein AB0M02_31110 [Actinoplanes sp. NPDC051861]|uniref:magnesium transporter MgtE N-terminal domain-containing protein n=1 Tax=Actinoplanes sp. NPDC051861 TaxID=3155170 RepID=UPI00342029C6
MNADMAARLVMAEPLDEVVDPLAQMSAEPAAACLSRVPAGRASAVLAAMNEANAALILSSLAPEPAAATLDEMPTEVAANLLARIPSDRFPHRVRLMQTSKAAAAILQIPGWARQFDQRNLADDDRLHLLDAMPELDLPACGRGRSVHAGPHCRGLCWPFGTG